MYKNPEDKIRYARQHYLDNKDKYKARAKKFTALARRRNREYVTLFLLSHPCVDCGITDLRVLQFDHVRGKKELTISVAVNRGWSIKKIDDELQKCEVRCANCHQIKTGKQLGWHNSKVSIKQLPV